jgi:hypothetical protein
MHAKERAVAPAFRRVLGADVVPVADLDTDVLGTFSGEVPRPDTLVETSLIKAELVFRTMDVDCAIASEGSYGPIDRLPLTASGVEVMAFVDRRRGVRLFETLATHRTNWKLLRFKAGDPSVPIVLRSMGFPEYGVFVICSSNWDHPVKGLSSEEEVIAAMNREAGKSDDGMAVLVTDMRAHRNPLRMKVVRAHVVEARQAPAAALPELRGAGLRPHRVAAWPALRGLRRPDRLDRLRDRRLFGLRPCRGPAAPGWAPDRLQALLPELPGRLTGFDRFSRFVLGKSL